MTQEPVTLLFTWKVTKGRHDDFEQWLRDVNEASKLFPGHLGVTWLRGGHHYYAILRFSDPESLRRWLSSGERAAWVDKLQGMATESAPRATTTGMETWFSLPGRVVTPPPKWKMTIVSFAAVYPCGLLFQWLVAGHLLALPVALQAMVLPLLLSPLLTYVLMPKLSVLLRRWLYPGSW